MSLIHDPSLLHLGKLPAKQDPRTLRLEKYMAQLPPAPTSLDLSPAAGPLGMMGNDRLGDCTCAAIGHMIQVWTGNAKGRPTILADQDIIQFYEKSGYNPGTPDSDRGWFLLDALNALRDQGIGGDKIVAYAAVNPKNAGLMQQATALFGGLYTGLMLPTTAQSQTVWDTTTSSPQDAGSWGGHCVPLCGYFPGNAAANWFQRLFGVQTKETAQCITWGATKRLTWDFIAAYMDEAYAIVTQDWIEANGQSPTGFDVDTLLADLQEVTA